MTTERAPVHGQPLVPGQADTTPWSFARERLANPRRDRRAGSPRCGRMAART
jgi:hypothetical protein